jgi:hypothetical protein
MVLVKVLVRCAIGPMPSAMLCRAIEAARVSLLVRIVELAVKVQMLQLIIKVLAKDTKVAATAIAFIVRKGRRCGHAQHQQPCHQ